MPVHSLEMRARVWEALEQGASSLEAAEQFGVPDSWVRLLRQNMRRRGHLGLLPRPGRRRQLDAAAEEQVRQWVRAEPQVTLKQLAERSVKHVGRLLCEATMSRGMKRLGITKKNDAWQLPSATASGWGPHGKRTSPAGSTRARGGGSFSTKVA